MDLAYWYCYRLDLEKRGESLWLPLKDYLENLKFAYTLSLMMSLSHQNDNGIINDSSRYYWIYGSINPTASLLASALIGSLLELIKADSGLISPALSMK